MRCAACLSLTNPALRAFRHFLLEHIRFDSDPNVGHGALSRHLSPDDRILPLWTAFRDLFRDFVPELTASQPNASEGWARSWRSRCQWTDPEGPMATSAAEALIC